MPAALPAATGVAAASLLSQATADYKNNPSNSVSLGRTSVTLIDTNSTGTTKLMNTAGFSDAALQKEVFEYAQQLAGDKVLKPAGKSGVWFAKLDDGATINVRNVSSSGAGRWTVDVQRSPTLSSLGYSRNNQYEVKFK